MNDLNKTQQQALDSIGFDWESDEPYDGRTLAALERRGLIQRDTNMVKLVATKPEVPNYLEDPEFEQAKAAAQLHSTHYNGNTAGVWARKEKIGTKFVNVYHVAGLKYGPKTMGDPIYIFSLIED